MDTARITSGKRGTSCILSEVLGRAGGLLHRASERMEDAARVTRFLAGLTAFRPREDDVFVVTYPRSGTTWMQFILHQLLTDGAMDFQHISEPVPWFERSLAAGYLSPADVEALPSPRLFKSHLPRAWVPAGVRVVLVERDVRDVALSYFHFYRSHLRHEGDLDAFVRRMVRGQVQYGSHAKHVAGWRAALPHPRLHWERFERLRADLAGAVADLAAFLDVTLTPERRERVLTRCTFDYMKRHEDRFDFITEHLIQKGYRQSAFLRHGQAGEGAAALSPEQRRTLEQAGDSPPRRPTLELDLPKFLR